MTRFVALAAAAATAFALVAAAFPGTARAAGDGLYQCATNQPGGDVLTCVPAGYGAEAPAPAQRSLTGRTHNWLAPTGEMLAAGDAEVSFHGFIYATGAVGLTDNVELTFSAPVIPVFASIGARVGLTPKESPYKLVVGAGIWVPLFEEADAALLSATATVAYATPRLNLHGSISMLKPTAADDGEVAGIVNVGGSIMIGRKVALFGELVQVGIGDEAMAEEIFTMSAVGMKFIGASTDIDVGLVVPTVDGDDGEIVALPMITVTHKF